MMAELHPAMSEGGKGHSPFLTLLLKIKLTLDWSGRIIAVASLAALFLVLFINVTLRYLFNSGIAWAYEIHGLLLPWLVAGGLLIAVARRRNIAITLLPESLLPKPQRLVLITVEVMTLVIALTVLLSSAPILRAAQYQTFSTIPISQYWGYISLIYAFVGIAVLAVIDCLILLVAPQAVDFDPANGSLS